MATVSELFVRIGADTAGLTRGLALASAQVKKFGTSTTAASATGVSSAARIGGAFTTAAAGVGVALGAMTIAAVNDFQTIAGETRTLEKQLGTTAEQASILRAQGEALGVGVDKLSVGFGIFSKHLVAGDAVLAQYGITAARTADGQLDFQAILSQLSDTFNAMPPGLARTAAAMNLFGRSGKSLLPLLAANSEELATFAQNARDAGLVMSEEDVTAARELSIAQRELGAAFDGLQVSLARAVIPILTDLAEVLRLVVAAIGPALPLIRSVGLAFLAYKLIEFIPILFGKIAAGLGALVAGLTGTTAATTAQTATTIDEAAAMTLLASAITTELVPALAAVVAMNGEVAASAGLAAGAEAAIPAGFAARASGLIVPGALAGGAAAGGAAVTGGLGASVTALAGPIALGVAAVAILHTITSKLAQEATEAKAAFDLIAQSTVQGATSIEDFNAAAAETREHLSGVGLDLFDQALEQVRPGVESLALGFEVMQQKAALAGAVIHSSVVAGLADLDPQIDKASAGLAQMGVDVSAFRKDARDALRKSRTDFGAWGTFTRSTLQSAAQAMQSWQAAAAESLNFVDDAFGTIASNFEGNAGKIDAALTKAFSSQRRFARDLNSIIADGTKGSKLLVQQLVALGPAGADAAHAIAGASEETRGSIEATLRKAQEFAATTAADLSKQILGTLGDIRDVLQAITKRWGITVDVGGNARSELAAIGDSIAQLPSRKTIQIIVQRGFHAGGLVMHAGGMVPPSSEVMAHAARLHSGGMGPGEVPAILQQGEFVMQRHAVQSIGLPTLQTLNRMHSGGPVEVPWSVPGVGQVAKRGDDLKVDLSVDRRRFGRALDYDTLASGR